MTVSVADRSSNKQEQIVHAAEVIGRSTHRAKVFNAIYTGQKQAKSVSSLMKSTDLPRTRVLDAGKRLAVNDLVTPERIGNETHYRKIPFFQRHRDHILKLATNTEARHAVPTKRRPAAQKTSNVKVSFRIPTRRIQAEQITIDDVDSFSKVTSSLEAESSDVMSESRFRDGMAAVLGEKGQFKDWGGELRDLSSTRVRLNGKRVYAAFAFKGPGTKGKLTPKKMGKNGDQIQRLFKCPVRLFVVQYQGEVDDSVYEQMEAFAQIRSYLRDEPVFWMVIDGEDSRRIVEAYPSKF